MWATEAYYDLLGTTFHVRSEVSSVGEGVDRLLAPFRRPTCGVPGRRRYSLVEAKQQTGGHALFRDCSAMVRHDAWAYVTAALLSQLNMAAVEEFAGFAVHAGVVATDGRVVAFPADSGEGKSTLTAACLRTGFDYVSDEALCVDYTSRRVVPYAKPVMLSPASVKLVGSPGQRVSFDGEHEEAAFVPDDLGSRPADGELRLTDLVRLQRGTGRPQLHPLPASEAVGTLLGRSFNHYKRPRDAFELVTDLARSCRVWRLEYDDPVQAADLMMDRLGSAVSRSG